MAVNDPANDPVDDPEDALERARSLVRAERPTGWVEVSDGVLDRMRTLPRPARQFRAADGTLVSSRALVPLLRAAVDGPTRVAEDVQLVGEHRTLVAVQLELVCTYGPDLRLEGERASDAARAVVADTLGAEVVVRVRVVDVVEGDPRAT